MYLIDSILAVFNPENLEIFDQTYRQITILIWDFILLIEKHISESLPWPGAIQILPLEHPTIQKNVDIEIFTHFPKMEIFPKYFRVMHYYKIKHYL